MSKGLAKCNPMWKKMKIIREEGEDRTRRMRVRKEGYAPKFAAANSQLTNAQKPPRYLGRRLR